MTIVDNGSRPEDAAFLNSLPARLITPGSNLGYAGGVNLGVEASDSDRLVIMNPDVRVLPGSIYSLLDVLERGVSAAGPRFYADDDKSVMLPPLIEKSQRSEIIRRMGILGERWEYRARYAWRRQARRHWLATQPIQSFDLVGAMLAIRRDAWEAVGQFDDTFPLYYEEMDWLWRLRNKGLVASYVPAAEAVHYFGQSAFQQPRADEWFKTSTRIFENRYYRRWFARSLQWGSRVSRLISWKTLDRRVQQANVERPHFSTLPDRMNATESWVELSLSPSGLPAACCALPADIRQGWQLPAAVWDRLAPGTYTARLVGPAEREHAVGEFSKGESAT
jgi:GT2 family glycosyltransferase